MKKLLLDKKNYFLLTMVGVFIFTVIIQTNAQNPGGTSGCITATVYYPRNYRVDKNVMEACTYCVTNSGAGGMSAVFHNGVQIGINYTRIKQTTQASTTTCKYDSDVNAYCTQIYIAGGYVDCSPVFVPINGYTGTAPLPQTGAGGTFPGGGGSGTGNGTGTGTGTGVF